MNETVPAPSGNSSWPAVRSWFGFAAIVVALWFGMIRFPQGASIEIFDAPAMALDYAARQGTSLDDALAVFTGPLGALLTGVHSGQPLAANFWCQVLVNLTFALAAAWAARQFTGKTRWWYLGVFAAVACYRPEYGQLSVLLLAALWLAGRGGSAVEATGAGAVLGLVALIDSRFAWLAALGVTLGWANPDRVSGTRALKFAGGAFLLTVVVGWLWTGQRFAALPGWLWHGLTAAPARHAAAAASWTGIGGWAAATWLVVLALLGGSVIGAIQTGRAALVAAFSVLTVFLAWRRATGEPDALPQLFFATAVMLAMTWLLLRPTGSKSWGPRAATVSALVAGWALGSLEPRIPTQAILVLNQNIDAAVRVICDRAGWQASVEASSQAISDLFPLPTIKTTTAGKSVDVLGNAIGYGLVNQLKFAPRPGLQSFRVETAGLALRDAVYYLGDHAPDFVAQRLQAYDRGLPPAEDALAQLALYERYDFQFEENGFVLWQRKPGPPVSPAAPEPVWETEARWGQTVSLPMRSGRAFLLAIRTVRWPTGWVKHHLLPAVDPTLLLRDEDGTLLSYRISPDALATGFLVNPLFRGEIDLIRYQAGETLPAIRELTLVPPAGRKSDFNNRFQVVLYEVPVPAVSGRKESAAALAQRYRICDRLPVAAAAYFPPHVLTADQKDLLMMHPDSSLEYPVRPGDARLRGQFGMVAASYLDGNATDGVEFVAEYFPANGHPTVLWRRTLDPLQVIGDRGTQSFSVELPQPADGRVILRTQNAPGHHAGWDWSYWTDLRFDTAPASH